jgi:PTS system galactitol-specific IIB component
MPVTGKRSEQMNRKKRVVVLCGAGFATSTAGEAQVAKICKELGIEAEIVKRQVREMKTSASMGKVDLYVTMTPVTLELDAPSVNGIAFISGVGKQAVIDKIKEILTAED